MNTVTDLALHNERKIDSSSDTRQPVYSELLHLQVEAAVSLLSVGEDNWHVAPVSCDSVGAVYILVVRKQRTGI